MFTRPQNKAFQLGKTLRENADYYGDFSESGARGMVDKAQEFLEKTKELLIKKKEI